MKVDRNKFTEAVQYLSEINQADFDSLDFSEFFDVTDPEYAQFHEEFKMFGLSNKDFITMQKDKWIQINACAPDESMN